MPQFKYGTTSIHYEETGSGFPVLLIAPGAMNSAIPMWKHMVLNPLEVLVENFRLIAMDQRNAGRSTGPLDTAHPWAAYADDQLALIDHLGIEEFHVMGACIGVSFALKLIERAPGRVRAAVLQQPVGVNDDNRDLYEQMWRSWGEGPTLRSRFSVDEIEAFGEAMWCGDFVLSVSRDFIDECVTPLMVLPGTDEYHPAETAHEIAALARDAVVFDSWKGSAENLHNAVVAILGFFGDHATPQRH